MNSTVILVGQRVRLLHDVDRYPHFIAPAGCVGTITHYESFETLCVKMDERIPGAEEWDNEVVWSIRDGDDPADDIEVI